MDLKELQQLIETMYSAKDRKRGPTGTFLWLMEEVGELAAAVGEGTPTEKEGEFADVLAWLATLANVEGIDLNRAMENTSTGVPVVGRWSAPVTRSPRDASRGSDAGCPSGRESGSRTIRVGFRAPDRLETSWRFVRPEGLSLGRLLGVQSLRQTSANPGGLGLTGGSLRMSRR